ncbi:MAG: Crp/Fnr family transcriptional regulator [Rhodothermales bacterium]
MHGPTDESVPLDALLVERFPFLKDAADGLLDALVSQGIRKRLAPGDFICLEGNQCTFLPFVLEGRARVYKASDAGREITLYRIEAGESCVLTASCILNRIAFPAFAIAETSVEGFLVPAPVFRSWIDEYSAWRMFVFDLFAQRLSSIINVVEEVVFRRLDARLATFLTEAGEDRVAMTHEAIATELGSSREVVSRLLKEFQLDGLVELERGVIHLADRQGLRRRAQKM